MNKGLLAVLAIVVIAGVWLIGSYNSFVGQDQNVKTAWAQVQNDYQRRLDLIPNLVETVKGYAAHEKSTFEEVTAARASVGGITLTADALKDPVAVQKFQAAQAQVSGALSHLLAVAENYPQLKASEQFLALQAELEGTENRIAVERKRYNDAVQSYNVKAKGIPGVWLVSIFGFDKEKALFTADDGAQKAPQVKF